MKISDIANQNPACYRMLNSFGSRALLCCNTGVIVEGCETAFVHSYRCKMTHVNKQQSL